MGFLDIFRRHKPELRTIIKEYYGNDIGLFARAYASSIYDIPEVRTAIECFADIFSTIPIYFERVDKNGHITYFETADSRVLTLQANPLQSSVQFWKEVVTRYMLDNNVFIEPIFDSGSGALKQVYVLPPENFAFDLSGDSARVRFMRSGKIHNMADLIYLNRFANISGGKRNNLGLYETVLQSLAQQAINVAKPNKVRAFLSGKAGTSGVLKERDKVGTMEDFRLNMDNNVQGVSYLDGQWTVTPVNWQENDVNRALMQFVINIAFNYFSMTQKIINNEMTELEGQFFIQNRMKPFAKQAEQAFTAKVFSKREIEFGNKIEFDTFALSVSTLSAKTALFSVGGRGGFINIDEGREFIGLPPLPDGLGQMHRVTGDTMDIKVVNEMQAAQKGATIKNKKEQNEDGQTSSGS